jgi:hypothetical protein
VACGKTQWQCCCIAGTLCAYLGRGISCSCGVVVGCCMTTVPSRSCKTLKWLWVYFFEVFGSSELDELIGVGFSFMYAMLT